MPHFTPIDSPAATLQQGTPRYFSGINWVGLWTLYQKEVMRFAKIFMQTIVAPSINGLLFLAIFALALGQYRPAIGNIDFITFLAPGLIMMSVIQNAFANTSSSFLIAKVQGSIVDYLMPPLSAGEITVAMIFAGITRGIAVAFGTGIVMLYFVELEQIHHLPLLIFHIIGAGMLMALIGLLAGIWSEKFDHLQSITNFIIVPLSFLSGTFYSISQLPQNVAWLIYYNPIYYMIDGVRYAFTGYTDGSIEMGVFVITGLNAALWLLVYFVMRSGWRLKT